MNRKPWTCACSLSLGEVHQGKFSHDTCQFQVGLRTRGRKARPGSGWIKLQARTVGLDLLAARGCGSRRHEWPWSRSSADWQVQNKNKSKISGQVAVVSRGRWAHLKLTTTMPPDFSIFRTSARTTSGYLSQRIAPCCQYARMQYVCEHRHEMARDSHLRSRENLWEARVGVQVLNSVAGEQGVALKLRLIHPNT
eukprot:3423169-Rhodomonas_salina.1